MSDRTFGIAITVLCVLATWWACYCADMGELKRQRPASVVKCNKLLT